MVLSAVSGWVTDHTHHIASILLPRTRGRAGAHLITLCEALIACASFLFTPGVC